MKNYPEQQITQTPDSENTKRLRFKKSEGWYKYGRIPWKIYYMFNCPSSDELVDEKKPGMFKITPDSGGGESLSIYIHESVPAEFKDIVAFHELREAELFYADNLEDDNQAHLQAAIETEEYAKKHLTEEEYKRFAEWQSTLNYKKN